jgi:hypothetical protein
MKVLFTAAAAAGLFAPIAASATELNIAGINQYAGAEQVTSVSQFSEVQPTDWAYQALSNLIERYGCVAGYPNGTYMGGKALSRYEAAALLNACLDRVSEVTDELKRLLKEFGAELAVIKGRVDGLEAKVGELEATQFSTTTKLKGEAIFALGGVPGYETKAGVNSGNTAFNYDLRLNFDTSFSGADLLRTRLRSSNFSTDPFGSSSSLFKLDKADNTTGDSGNEVVIDRLYYQFPVLDGSTTLTAGALVRNTEMSWIPSAYKSEILDFFAVAGAPGVYNKATGAGFGVQYGKKGIVAGLNYVAQNGQDSETGVFDENGAINTLAQIGYRGDNYGVAFGYRYGTEGTRVRTYNGLNGASGALAPGQTSNGYAINAYWQPEQSGIIPSVSGGFGWNTVSGTPSAATDSQSWFAGLQWSDVFVDGNSAGVAVGQAPTGQDLERATMLEIFYKYQVSDNISVTPALFYASDNQRLADNASKWGGVIQTKFTF